MSRFRRIDYLLNEFLREYKIGFAGGAVIAIVLADYLTRKVQTARKRLLTYFQVDIQIVNNQYFYLERTLLLQCPI